MLYAVLSQHLHMRRFNGYTKRNYYQQIGLPAWTEIIKGIDVFMIKFLLH